MGLLKEGDVIRLKKGHRVYTQLPKHFLYDNTKGDWELARGEVTVGEPRGDLLTGFFEGDYIVVKTTKDGGGTGHGPHDVYPDGHHVWCEKIMPERNHGTIKIEFFQSGSFTCMIPEIEPIGHAQCTWHVK